MKKLLITLAVLVSTSAFAAQDEKYIVKNGNELITCDPSEGVMPAICNFTIEPAGDVAMTIPTAIRKGVVACGEGYNDAYGRTKKYPVINVTTGVFTCVGSGVWNTLKGLLEGFGGAIEDIFNH